MARRIGALVVAGCLCVAGGALVVSQHHAQHAYRALAQEHLNSSSSGAPKVDWRELQQINPDIVGWLHVEDSEIDCPVVQATSHNASWYLSHDFWGAPSPVGCPFLAAGTNPTDARLTIYGHHITGTTAAFSSLSHMWSQDSFEELGRAWWAQPDGSVEELEVLCAAEVRESDGLYLESGALSQSELASWLERAYAQASAREADIPKRPRRALTLVTCSRDLPGQPWRCVVTFVRSS